MKTKPKNLMPMLMLLLAIAAPVPQSFAGKDYTNHLKRAEEAQAYRTKIKEIPIYREKLEGSYMLLGPVRGQDMLTNKKSAIMAQMRDQAFKMGANAIMEFQCDKILKRTFMQCEGFAVRIP